MKTPVRTMGPPWELCGGGGVLLFSGQESEVKARYHEIDRSRSVLPAGLYVRDPQGTRYTWDRRTFRWEATQPQPA